MGLLFAVLLMGLPLAFAVWDTTSAPRRGVSDLRLPPPAGRR